MHSSLLLSGKKTTTKQTQKAKPPKTNLVQNCSAYVFWPVVKCSETNGRNLIAFIASSGFWVKSSSINESFISMISALQQMIKNSVSLFCLEISKAYGFCLISPEYSANRLAHRYLLLVIWSVLWAVVQAFFISDSLIHSVLQTLS